jgi:hypothetical protein
MNIHRPGLMCLMLMAVLAVAGCEAKQEESAEHAHGEHEEEAPSGASYKNGKGVLVKDDTKKILGLETVAVTEKPITRTVEFSVQAFHDGNDARPHWLAMGTLPASRLAGVTAGQEVALRTPDGKIFTGRMQKFDASVETIHSEVEAVIEVPGAMTFTQPVSFLHATLTLPGSKAVLVVPHSAILRTAEGLFVYAVNGEAFQRTAVKIGAEADGLVEITDGLLEGDSVVTKPVESLYLVELRATKGGGHSH